MIPQPTLTTPRLILRPYRMEDVADVTRLIGDPDVSTPLLNVPYPYHESDAIEWISGREAAYLAGESAQWAFILATNSQFLGGGGVMIDQRHKKAELGYWVGKEYWGLGFVTEATKAIVDWAFLFTDLNRVFARHATTNPASGRVMQKIGMSFEGVLRQDARKGDRYIDHAIYGLLRQDWLKQHQQNQISLETDRYDRS